MISVVIPAHNESATIGRLLGSLTDAVEPGEIEIVVAANGCTDRTAEIAGSFDRVSTPVTVLELADGNKPAALNAADQVARHFPRFYIDSDIVVDMDAIRACRAAIESGSVAAAPRLTVDTTNSSWLVRSYYRIWLTRPWVTENLVGSGFIALSQQGRARFGDFPALGADDLWVSRHLRNAERTVVSDHTFGVTSSENARQLIRRNARIRAANAALRSHYPLPYQEEHDQPAWRSFASATARRPIDLGVFAIITLATRFASRRMIRRGVIDWNGDRASSKVSVP